MNTQTAHESSKRRLGFAASQLAILAAAVVVPKCPLCIVAYLTAFGLSTAVAHQLAPWLLPAIWGALVVSTVYVAARLLRRRNAAGYSAVPVTHSDRCCGG